ncbi:DNA invertase Pin-like site-specific DNA recombinase [Alkalibacillus flavidus]|uniref:DNA invertase Pin-like site-specific DNA recombinase n=1 Tax=Alkalibacillus flavidus TaxID=546021 RepID=A0ABV2KVF1_9BACI
MAQAVLKMAQDLRKMNQERTTDSIKRAVLQGDAIKFLNKLSGLSQN